MAWGFRRSKTFGGVRFTLSKSGISTSIGRKGFRLTGGPRGVYITTGAGGFYYRQRIDGSPRGAGQGTPPWSQSPSGPVVSFASADLEQLTDVDQREFVETLNKWTTRGSLQIVTALIGVAMVTILSLIGDTVAVEGTAYALIAFATAAWIERRRRTVVLMYDLDDAAAARFERLRQGLQAVAASDSVQGVKLKVTHGDWKRHAGATEAIDFDSARFCAGTPPYVETNISMVSLQTQGKSLYFLPDRLLVRERRRFAAISYDRVVVETALRRFIWSGRLPNDAEVVGQSWRYVRRDGGPDRRFSNNRQLPVVRVAYLSLESGEGLRILLQVTRANPCIELASLLSAYGESASAKKSAERSAVDIPAGLRAPLAALGLSQVPSTTELRARYLDLIKRNHPDRYATAPPGVRDMAETRTKEINVAYEALRSAAIPDAPEPIIETPPVSAVSTAVAAHKAEASALGLAAGAALLVFVAFRTLPLLGVSGNWATSSVPQDGRNDMAAGEPMVAPSERATDGFGTMARIPRNCTIRERPSVSARSLGTVRAGSTLEVSGRRSGWVHGTDERGITGWTGPPCWK